MRIAGHAAIFDVADGQGDIVRRGAFADARAPLPLLLEHDPARRIGTVTTIAEDARGLRMEAELWPAGVRAARRIGGLSFGFRAERWGTNRELTHVGLIELSLVARPMQPLARVDRIWSEENEMVDVKSDARPVLSGAVAGRGAAGAFVDNYLRAGRTHEVKSASGASGIDGGYAVPREIDGIIERLLKAASPIRTIANVVQVGSAGYRKLVSAGGTPSGWVSETADRPETDTPDFHEIVPPSGELYANPAASQAMLDDAAFDLEGWLADEIAAEFARAEGAAFVAGSGVNRPKGFVTYPTSSDGDGTRAFGTLQHVASGAAGGFGGTAAPDRLIDLVHALKGPYRQGASFVMNAATLAVIRKFKTADGAFLWQPGLLTGQPDTLLGYPVVEADAMPDIAANSLSIAFGNFKAGYLIADRAETQILRDPYSHKPFVHFYATRRVGGAVVNSEAIKLMKFAAA
ncbi:HK97 family phage major capsid protein/HK97 family phage prohead protease [Sphingomonas jejuensis]|uniref:HK97 family phage major capsid protein/HK97 family phage prohead protease n=1 Tax=Sphingomonas jejuensis TaxID=904715 RepID=A0ABX0XHK4_9SPHN|nr:phage major capsid protein [Sphingomonas jejuensis]NJC32817.1 HK97 family phage major capsid protein/HK97 family phage prohead protease [Sphingomonas jejuensis]